MQTRKFLEMLSKTEVFITYRHAGLKELRFVRMVVCRACVSAWEASRCAARVTASACIGRVKVVNL